MGVKAAPESPGPLVTMRCLFSLEVSRVSRFPVKLKIVSDCDIQRLEGELPLPFRNRSGFVVLDVLDVIYDIIECQNVQTERHFFRDRVF